MKAVSIKKPDESIFQLISKTGSTLIEPKSELLFSLMLLLFIILTNLYVNCYYEELLS